MPSHLLLSTHLQWIKHYVLSNVSRHDEIHRLVLINCCLLTLCLLASPRVRLFVSGFYSFFDVFWIKMSPWIPLVMLGHWGFVRYFYDQRNSVAMIPFTLRSSQVPMMMNPLILWIAFFSGLVSPHVLLWF
ncbi:hypothetical protein G6F46_006122 [Rhizopus delemar]|uniref:Uncharacterized protein n=2 Tax=Rhizopus TaxID=4842 RepID=A0A9P6Z549_9FUNG|nr:hypothetical protein G6F36_013291 [Rhizopus arrhizus]KAG1450240.1 hypothetical protein G6F55_009780 [Rhizopus delemar]KAG1501659.1 hypothetical protein G6F54_002886 [Rhizopus delemar]KAG1510527.1 hypothetical protein G6F52_010878 [Rhizopus delemar]KAG1511172.1 hypothetical protein G6F53_006142 [Rhizopus delemar]